MYKISKIKKSRWATNSLSIQEFGYWYFMVDDWFRVSRKTLGEAKKALAIIQYRLRVNKIPHFSFKSSNE